MIAKLHGCDQHVTKLTVYDNLLLVVFRCNSDFDCAFHEEIFGEF